MLNKIFTLIVLILVFIIVLTAHSEGQTPRPAVRSNPPQKQTTLNQQSSNNVERGTEQSPLIIKTINPSKTQAEVVQERRYHEKKSSQDWLVLSTAMLAFVALLQLLAFILQAYFLYKGFKATKIAAKAAKDATELTYKDLLISHRPWCLFPENIETIEPLSIESGKITGSFNRIVKNSGKTPAFQVTFNIKVNVITLQELMQYIQSGIHEIEGAATAAMPMLGGIILPGDTIKNIHDISQIIDMSKINQQNNTILLVMTVSYRDIFNIIHFTRQTWQYRIDGGKIIFPLTKSNKGSWRPFYGGNVVT